MSTSWRGIPLSELDPKIVAILRELGEVGLSADGVEIALSNADGQDPETLIGERDEAPLY